MIQSPEWLKKALFYEIYPQSFYDTNGDGIGDLNGVIAKLDYIKGLGFNAIWLNPIYDSPFYDAGYDVRDFKKVAPRYGTNEDAYRLFEEAHKRGMHVILDFVPGHTSIDHPWFKKSCLPEKNEYTDRYVWTNDVGQFPKGYRSINGFYDRNGSVMTNFFSIQPALNYGFYKKEENYQQTSDEPGPQSTIHDMTDVLRFWMSHGADGFRCDMADSLVKNDTPDHQGTAKVWHQMIDAIKGEFPEAVFVSEWNSPYESWNSGFDVDFLLFQEWVKDGNFMLIHGDHPYFSFAKPASLFTKPYFHNLQAMAKEGEKIGQHYYAPITGNHDVPRVSHDINEEEVKLYMAYLYTSRGVPFLYYGDEIGMTYWEGLPSKEGAYARAGSRTPMQWDSSAQAGFTTSDSPYFPVNPNKDAINVASEELDPHSLLHYVRDLLSFRKEHVALDNDANITFIAQLHAKPLVYQREKDGEKLLIAINPSNKEAKVEIPEKDAKVIRSYGEYAKEKRTLTLKEGSYVILQY